jgi:hypothetical protein
MTFILYKDCRAVVVMIICQLDLQLPLQSVPITTKVVSSNPTHGEVYSIQHYVIKFVSDLHWFSPDTPVSSTI